MPARPSIFISSTIYDFRDLRSALKYTLGELGCQVLASEHNDFPVDVSAPSYDACLKGIDQSQWFILLIGSRVGGWFNHAEKISITRQEYRHAYERALAGKIRILPFVRREIWDIAEDRKELEKWLLKEHHDVIEGSDDHKAITYHPGKAMSDAETIMGFLDEVRRIPEMKAARGGSGFPPFNWVFTLSGFRDVIEVVQREVGYDFRPARAAVIHNLCSELAENARNLLTPTTGGDRIVTWVEQHLTVKSASDFFYGRVELSSREMYNILVFKELCCLGYTHRAIDGAISSGEFLGYDTSTRRIGSTKIHSLLVALRRRMDALMAEESGLHRDAFLRLLEHSPATSKSLNERERGIVARALFARDRAVDIINISRALMFALKDNDMRYVEALELGSLHPSGRDQEPTAAQAERWLLEKASST